ncbi:unnamed protein product, partial [Rotaria sp. Silwood2]
NTYVYAPKDYAKHRSRWRDLFTNEESNELTQLINLAKQNGINFIYALSPEYCSRMAKPSLQESSYLQTIGNGLHPHIDIFWTGPKVVSRQISVNHIISVNNVLKRRVTIWDNLNANDYDQRRLCIGPFSGRSLKCSHLNGMLTNPNCEFELNFIPYHTLGQWFHLLKIDEKRDKIDQDNIQSSEIYQVDKALHQSIIDWLPEFNKIKLFDNSPQAMSPKTLLITDEDSPDSQNENVTTLTKIHKMECDINGDCRQKNPSTKNCRQNVVDEVLSTKFCRRKCLSTKICRRMI